MNPNYTSSDLLLATGFSGSCETSPVVIWTCARPIVWGGQESANAPTSVIFRQLGEAEAEVSIYSSREWHTYFSYDTVDGFRNPKANHLRCMKPL